MSQFGLTACLIVRDERANLESILPTLVGALDDVVVVDTGSTDGTQDYVASAGARLFEEPWRDDFSRARNAGLDQVRTSHAVWIDADDRIDPEALAELREACRERENTAFYLMLVNEGHDANSIASCWQLRAFPADDRHRFRGRVHEQIVESLQATGVTTEKLDLTVLHTGYARPEDVLRKARRNLELARRESAEGRSDTTVLYHWVKAAAQCEEFEEAAEVAHRLIDDPPPGTPTEVIQATSATLGNIYFRLGMPQESISVLRNAVRRVPDDALARFFLGDVYRQTGDYAAAREELFAARSAPIRPGQLPIPVLGLRQGIRIQLGEVLEKLGMPAEAAAIYREALDEQPEDRTLRTSLARALIGAGAAPHAARILDGLAPEHRDHPEVSLLRGLLAFETGQDDEARRQFARAAERLPLTPAAPLHLGHLEVRRGRIAEAAVHYREALRLADTPETRVGMAVAELESGRPAAALDHLAAAVDQCTGRPLPAGTEALSGEALFRIHRPQEALGAFEKHLERNGPEGRVLSRVADCYRALGATEAARVGYQEALKLSPDLQEAARGLRELSAAG